MNTPPYALIASFLAFTEARNMQEAAKGLKISQPALTSHLKSFEEYFPQPVFSYEGRRKVLTGFGEELKSLLTARFAYLDQDLNLLNERVQDPKNNLIRIAARQEILAYLAGHINYPGTLEFIAMDTESVAVNLRDRKFDIGITYDLRDVTDLHSRKLFIYSYSIVFPSSWKMNASKLSDDLVERLSELPYLSHRPRSENLTALLKKYQITKSVYYKKVLPDWNRLVDLVAAGEGWAIVPDHFTIGKNRLDAVPIPTSLIPEVQFYMLYHKEAIERPWFKNLLEQLKKVTQSV
jgi:DNA-binding transcriptional LysR family regulator